jgi:hypothetical protein
VGLAKVTSRRKGLTMELRSLVNETLAKKKKTKGRRGSQVAKSRKPRHRALDLRAPWGMGVGGSWWGAIEEVVGVLT